MPELAQVKLEWQPREAPLLPVAVAGQGDTSRRLARRLLQLDDETLSQLEGVAGNNLIVVRGPAELLPWVEGVQYLGTSSSSSLVLWPTTYCPTLPEPLVAAALSAKAEQPGMLAVLLQPLVLAPMRDARAISRAILAAWLERP